MKADLYEDIKENLFVLTLELMYLSMGSSNLTVAAEWNTIDTFSVTVLTSSFDNPKLGSKISPVIGINFATCSGFLTFQS